MGSSSVSVYFVLGTPGSGRREIVLDLVENGLGPAEKVLVLLASHEEPNPSEERLSRREATQVLRRDWTPAQLPEIDLPTEGTVFFLADPRGDAITQLESLQPWLLSRGAQLARVFTVVDCQFAEKHAAARAWFDACVHFSDVVFLTRRAGVENKWVSDFMRHFEAECSPALFIQLKKGGLANPALVLSPEPRRLSQYFDETEDFSGLEIETDDDEEPEEGEDDGLPAAEPYFERLRSGRRAREVPDITKYLPAGK
ncbi:MAG TPA: hypothetical protein VHD32_17975 [Candidatus Didemnitutus sp.]|nr:hypothetical protein [Candidatus Didemnitutus sp.]